MLAKCSLPTITNLLALGLCAIAITAFPVNAGAQSSGAVAQSSTEMDAILFVQAFPMKNGKDAIELDWVPKPLERLCLGKTSQQCAAMDYCMRTTIATSACAATSAFRSRGCRRTRAA